MTDLLTDALPTTWEGRRIDPDFRHMVWLLNTYRRAETDEEKVQLMHDAAERFFAEPVSDPQLPDAFASLMRFFRGCADDAPGGEPPEADAGAGEITLDYHCDAAYVLGAFQQAYGIDLTTDKVHWWRFMALMQALPQETALSQILQIRTTDTSEMDPATRQRYEAAKERYALPPELKGGARDVTPQQHDAAFLARFR